MSDAPQPPHRRRFPVPQLGDGAKHVFVSVGHQQMMTDAMKPLGLSVWQLTALRPMHEAGGRLFVDVTAVLAAPPARAALLDVIGKSDPLIRDALETVLAQGDVVPDLPAAPASTTPAPFAATQPLLDPDPAIVRRLIERERASLASLREAIARTSGLAVFELIRSDVEAQKGMLVDQENQQAIMTGHQATWWLNEHLEDWLGETNGADVLSQSAPGNVTSEMGLALLDVADVVRRRPAVVALLRSIDPDAAGRAQNDELLDSLLTVDGGAEVRDAIAAYLDVYGMRCVGEIDLTRPRWSERPSLLVPLLLGHVDRFGPGTGRQRLEEGLDAARRREHEVLDRLRALPDGDEKAAATKAMIDRVRTFIGYREYPKYGIVSRSFLYKQALLREADALVAAGALAERDDAFFLRFEELEQAVRTGHADRQLIDRRKEEHRSNEALVPPRVLTSDGAAFDGSYRRTDVPDGALVGLPVSVGIVEGRARVLVDLGDAQVEPGDILVTTHTDPSWSPLLVAVSGLVTEVGGLMTHGAVVAREYGLPAVVGVLGATRLIRDGQRIRLNAHDGIIELLPD